MKQVTSVRPLIVANFISMSRKSTKSSDQHHQESPEHSSENNSAQPNTPQQTADELVDVASPKKTNDQANGEVNNQSPTSAIDVSEDDSAADLIEKLNTAQSQIEALKEDYIRAKAEMENIRRRSQNEMVSARKYAIEGFAQELLSVVDSMEQAALVEIDKPNGEAVINMQKGLELTLKQFDKAMEKFGVIAVEAVSGVKFNPEVHQAISVLASDEIEPEHIVTVMQKGFLLKDRLLRPAMVVIAKNPE